MLDGIQLKVEERKIESGAYAQQSTMAAPSLMKDSHRMTIDTYPAHMIKKGTSRTIPFPTER